MTPSRPLPYDPQFTSTKENITSLLLTFTSDALFKALYGGAHILDFSTRDSDTEPADLYHEILLADWALFFSTQELSSILHYLPGMPKGRLP